MLARAEESDGSSARALSPVCGHDASLRANAPRRLRARRVDRTRALDNVTVRVEMREQELSDKMREMQVLREKIHRRIQSITGLRMNVELVEPKTLERSMGKAVRVVDKRKIWDGPR